MTKKCSNFVKDILFLQFPNVESPYDVFCIIAPYINEITNVITICITKPYYNISLYPHYSNNFKRNLIKMCIDVIAIFGISANASKYGETYNKIAGLIKGIILSMFSFFIPNLFLRPFLENFSSNHLKFLFGLLFIYLMDFMVNLLMCSILNNTKILDNNEPEQEPEQEPIL